jgi:hypothetical protein
MKKALAIAAMLAFGAAAGAAEWHVSPSGKASNSGSASSTWDLATGLSSSSIHAGDTVWLHDGIYVGSFACGLNGGSGSGQQITIRQAVGERARIDGLLTIGGSNTWYWGIEDFCSNPDRTVSGAAGINVSSSTANNPGIKLINMAVHDTNAVGIGFWAGALNGEVNGCLSYFNGFDGPDRGHCHGIYTQNVYGTGTKKIYNNIFFMMFGWGMHCYTEGGDTSGYDWNGNTSFNNGYLSAACGGFSENFIILGPNPRAHSVQNVYTYFSEEPTFGNKGDNHFDPTDAMVIKNCYMSGYTSLLLVTVGGASTNTITGNTFHGATNGVTASSYPSNTYIAGYPTRPTVNKVFVRPSNTYEAGRANVTVYNWSKAATVSADLTGVLANGDAYEVRDAMNYFGNPVATGVYNGSPLTLPMTGLTIAPASGACPRQSKHTAPEFGVFVVRKVSAGSVVVYGDANGDGAFSMADLNLLVDWLLVRKTAPASGTAAFRATDVNGDNQLTMADLNLMVDRLLGRITKFPVEP